jgi:predicted XRE-type DNA-binding protein
MGGTIARRASLPSGNVFQDLGFEPEEAANLRIRAELMLQLSETIHALGLTQSAAAKLLGVTQPRVSDVVRGRIDLFSIDALVNMLGRAGVRIRLSVEPPREVA